MVCGLGDRESGAGNRCGHGRRYYRTDGDVLPACASGVFGTKRGTNMLDGGAHFCRQADEYISIGSIQPQFVLLMEKAKLVRYFQPQMDRGRWGELKAKLTEVF